MRAVLVLISLAACAFGERVAPPPLDVRVARAELVVLGKVVRVEDRTVDLPASPGAKERHAFRVAVVEVKERLAGPSGSKTLKLAYLPPGRRDALFTLKAGDEWLLFLTRQHGTGYYRAALYGDVETPVAELAAQARKAGKLLANPLGGLRSKDAAERSLAARLLIVRYRTPPLADPKEVKEAEVPAPEGKLILEALAAADWKTPGYSQISPRNAFLLLGLTEKDGWKVTNLATLEADAKRWLGANAGKYRIRKYTAGVTAEP